MIKIPATTTEEMIEAVFGSLPDPYGINFLGYPITEMTKEELQMALIAVTRLHNKYLDDTLLAVDL